jgi:hypothetical protein
MQCNAPRRNVNSRKPSAYQGIRSADLATPIGTID